MNFPQAIVIPAVKKHTATIICVHGLGDTGAGWTFLAENWRRRGKFEDTKFIFPSASRIPITSNGGMAMPGWYDIINFDSINRSEDERGITRSRLYLHSLINQEIASGVPAKRIVLGGFSQGGAMSIFSGLTFTQRLAGVFGLSCYQLIEKKFDELRIETGDNKPPVFMGHGKEDPLVKLQYGQLTAEGLKKKGLNVDWREYEDTAHSVSMDEFDELEQWVVARMKENE